MAFQVPDAEELKRIARANHIELTAEELAALQGMMPGQMAVLERIDAITLAPQESVAHATLGFILLARGQGRNARASPSH